MVCHLATSVAFPVSRRPLEREMDGGAQRREYVVRYVRSGDTGGCGMNRGNGGARRAPPIGLKKSLALCFCVQNRKLIFLFNESKRRASEVER